MKNALIKDITIESFLAPETDIEKQLLHQPEFQEGLMWGKPRFGHPEGKVVFHIREVLDNIEKISLDDEQRERLRLITFVHDTFKYKECKCKPRDWSKHHGKLARNFTANYTDDQILLNIIDLHDEAYHAWRCAHVHKDESASQARIDNLMEHVGSELQLYYLFFKCDTRTGDKNQQPVTWFESNIKGIDVVDF